MNSTLNQTQRNLNNIKSIFGGVKNWWSGKKDPQKPAIVPSASSGPANGGNPNANGNAGGKDLRNHPAMDLRDGGRSGAGASTAQEDPYERETVDNLGMPYAPL